MSLLTDDTVFEDTSPPPDGRRIEGKLAVATFWREWFARNPDARFEAEEVVVLDGEQIKSLVERPQSPRGFSKEWTDVAASIGLPVTFHALRHTHASHLIDAGIDVVKISQRLGHASAGITLRVYAHLFRKRAALRSTLRSLHC